jgi:hypothetical protein
LRKKTKEKIFFTTYNFKNLIKNFIAITTSS